MMMLIRTKTMIKVLSPIILLFHFDFLIIIRFRARIDRNRRLLGTIRLANNLDRSDWSCESRRTWWL